MFQGIFTIKQKYLHNQFHFASDKQILENILTEGFSVSPENLSIPGWTGPSLPFQGSKVPCLLLLRWPVRS